MRLHHRQGLKDLIKMSLLPAWFINLLNLNSSKFLVNIMKTILKFKWKYKQSRIIKIHIKNNKVEKLALLKVKTYYKGMLIEIM